MADQEEGTQGTAEDQADQPAAEPQEITAAVGIIVAAYPQEDAADQTLDAMKQAKKQGTFYYENAAVIRQDSGGKVHISETGDTTPGKGAGIGAVLGGLLGLIGGPGAVVVGAGVGAGVGAAVASHDAGFRNEGLKEVGAALKPGTSAMVAVTSKDFLKALRAQAAESDLQAVSQDIAQQISDALDQGQAMGIGILLTDQGVAAKKVTADDESAQMFGIVVTDQGVVVGAAASDETGAAAVVAAADDTGAAAVVATTDETGEVVVNTSAAADDTEKATDDDAEKKDDAQA